MGAPRGWLGLQGRSWEEVGAGRRPAQLRSPRGPRPVPHAPAPPYPERGHRGQVHFRGAGYDLVSRQDACGRQGSSAGHRGPAPRLPRSPR